MIINELLKEDPQVGDAIDLECGDLLIETVIEEVTEDGIVVRLDENAMLLMIESRKKYIAESQQGVAEGLDPEKRARLDDLIDQFRDSTDPNDYYDRDYSDPEDVVAMIRAEFGDRIADEVAAGADKMHFSRPGHTSWKADPLGWKKPVDRTTKAGKMYKQDSDFRKNTIKSRYKLSGKSATEGVAEESDKLQGTPVVSLSDFDDRDHKKNKYGQTVPRKLKQDDPRVKFHKEPKKQGVAGGTEDDLDNLNRLIDRTDANLSRRGDPARYDDVEVDEKAKIIYWVTQETTPAQSKEFAIRFAKILKNNGYNGWTVKVVRTDYWNGKRSPWRVAKTEKGVSEGDGSWKNLGLSGEVNPQMGPRLKEIRDFVERFALHNEKNDYIDMITDLAGFKNLGDMLRKSDGSIDNTTYNEIERMTSELERLGFTIASDWKNEKYMEEPRISEFAKIKKEWYLLFKKAINFATTYQKQQGVAEGLNEFAPPGSNDGGDDGFSEETLKRLAAQWYNGDEDPRVERTLMAAGWEIGQDEGYDDEPGVFVVQAGDINGNSYISWPAHELKQGVAEGYINDQGDYVSSRSGEDPHAYDKYRQSKLDNQDNAPTKTIYRVWDGKKYVGDNEFDNVEDAKAFRASLPGGKDMSIVRAKVTSDTDYEEMRRQDERDYMRDKFRHGDFNEAEYQGRKVPLGKPFLTPDGPKKRSVYVKNPKGNVVKVNFGQKGVKIKKSNPARRRSFRARHGCDNPGPRHKARYWSCKFW